MTRCIAEHTPNGPQGYNSGTLITQSPGWIVMFRERLDTRIIPLDKRPHVDGHIRQWNGDSRGWWEGGTLVVETKHFTDKQIIGGGAGSTIPTGVPHGNMHLVERWVPVSATRLNYYATVTDPTVWTRPWTFMLPGNRTTRIPSMSSRVTRRTQHRKFLRGQRILDAKATADAAKGGQPLDRMSAGLVGATEAAVRAKLGEPASVEFNGTRWTYQTVGGTLVLHLFFAENKVKIVTPNDLPLDAVRRR